MNSGWMLRKRDWYVLNKEQKEEVYPHTYNPAMYGNLCMKKVYKIWNKAQRRTLTTSENGLSSDDIWSLFSTH